MIMRESAPRGSEGQQKGQLLGDLERQQCWMDYRVEFHG
jgi:hypothetical protein